MVEIASKDADNFGEKHDAVTIDVGHPAASTTTTAAENGSDIGLKPVPFRSLFRFSTRLELFLDSIGVCAAVIAGAAQVRSFFLSFFLRPPHMQYANVNPPLLNTKPPNNGWVFVCAFSLS